MYREQLQFNLHSPPKRFNLETNFAKPRPIVIEKLAPKQPEVKFQKAPARLSSNDTPFSSLSSERLEFAMQLAKRDVKKLKTMLANPTVEMPQVLKQEHVRPVPLQDQRLYLADDSSRKPKSSPESCPEKVIKQKIGKVLSTRQQEKDVNYKNGQLRFIQYKEDGDNKGNSPDKERPEGKEVTEIKRLRKELQKYMRRLDSVLDENSFSHGRKRERKGLLDEDTEKERKMLRAEEQASRSARVLYMLQRKVQEIQDEIQKQDGPTKHTRKSQHLTRLAAAHRSAVRALQMLVNQAPLYFDVKHGLPPMYQDLGLLIQQLSLLSSQLQIGKDLPEFDMDLLPRTKKLISNWNQESPPKTQPKVNKPRNQVRKKVRTVLTGSQKGNQVKESFLDQHAGWMREKARHIGIPDDSDGSNEPTPEREAVLKAGLDALKRARESSSYIAPDVKQRPGGVSFQIDKPIAASKRKPKSVLFPHHIKKQRNRPGLSRGRVILRQAQTQPMHFAQQTVASILKKTEEIKHEPKKKVQSPPSWIQNDQKSPLANDTPRQRSRKLIESVSPSSKQNVPRSQVSPRGIKKSLVFGDDPNVHHYDDQMMEKEVARQAWLDREREREIGRLDDLRTRESIHLQNIRQEYSKSQQMVDDVEAQIKTRLQPLLEKAELLSLQEKLREDNYKQSVRRRLGEIVTETAMSKGEVLAEMILDDVLMETINELQRIEQEEFAEGEAEFESNRPNIETVKMKLEEFEREEEEIRRRWKTFHYSELDTANESKCIAKGITEATNAKPIVFTAASERHYSLQGDQAEGPTSEKIETCDDEAVPVFVPTDLRASIMAYKRKHDNFLKHTMTEKHGNFDPWKLIERISEEILEEAVVEVGHELNDICSDYVEKIYADEFIRNDSLVSDASTDAFSKSIDRSVKGPHH